MLTTIRSNELRIDRKAKKYVRGVVRAIHSIAFFEGIDPEPVIVFGPPGIGKSTVLSTYRSYLGEHDYGGIILSDFEEVRHSRRTRLLSRWAREGGIIGAADLDPLADYPQMSHAVLLALAENHYRERRYIRDSRCPEKAGQSHHAVRTWKTIWYDRYRLKVERDGVIMYNDRVEDSVLWLCLLAFGRTPLNWSESTMIRSLVTDINNLPTDEEVTYKVVEIPCGYGAYTCLFEVTPQDCRMISRSGANPSREEINNLISWIQKGGNNGGQSP